MLIRLFKKIHKNINSNVIHGTSNKKMPFKKQIDFLEKFPKPKDDFELSFFKYNCFCEYCYYGRKWLLILYNIGSIFFYPAMYFSLRVKGKGKRKKGSLFDAVIENVTRLPNYDVIPEEIINTFARIVEIKEINYKDAFLSSESVKICTELRKRYLWNFYYRLIVMIKLAQFNGYIQEYNPKAIVFYSCEREFSSPLQTLLCESEGVEYISFMHGDYLLTLSFAFQKYSKYYIWDNAYKDFFMKLRCEFPMSVYVPIKLRGIARSIDDRECNYFASYYFSGETRSSMKRLYSAFRDFEKRGLRCKVRPHPRFTDIKMLTEIFKDILVEDTRNSSLSESITDSLYIVGLNSTVLSQAFFSGKKIVIDDVSMRDEYLELCERRYIMMNRPHILLSKLFEYIKDDNEYDETYNFFTG